MAKRGISYTSPSGKTVSISSKSTASQQAAMVSAGYTPSSSSSSSSGGGSSGGGSSSSSEPTAAEIITAAREQAAKTGGDANVLAGQMASKIVSSRSGGTSSSSSSSSFAGTSSLSGQQAQESEKAAAELMAKIQAKQAQEVKQTGNIVTSQRSFTEMATSPFGELTGPGYSAALEQQAKAAAAPRMVVIPESPKNKNIFQILGGIITQKQYEASLMREPNKNDYNTITTLTVGSSEPPKTVITSKKTTGQKIGEGFSSAWNIVPWEYREAIKQFPLVYTAGAPSMLAGAAGTQRAATRAATSGIDIGLKKALPGLVQAGTQAGVKGTLARGLYGGIQFGAYTAAGVATTTAIAKTAPVVEYAISPAEEKKIIKSKEFKPLLSSYLTGELESYAPNLKEGEDFLTKFGNVAAKAKSTLLVSGQYLPFFEIFVQRKAYGEAAFKKTYEELGLNPKDYNLYLKAITEQRKAERIGSTLGAGLGAEIASNLAGEAFLAAGATKPLAFTSKTAFSQGFKRAFWPITKAGAIEVISSDISGAAVRTDITFSPKQTAKNVAIFSPLAGGLGGYIFGKTAQATVSKGATATKAAAASRRALGIAYIGDIGEAPGDFLTNVFKKGATKLGAKFPEVAIAPTRKIKVPTFAFIPSVAAAPVKAAAPVPAPISPIYAPTTLTTPTGTISLGPAIPTPVAPLITPTVPAPVAPTTPVDIPTTINIPVDIPVDVPPPVPIDITPPVNIPTDVPTNIPIPITVPKFDWLPPILPLGAGPVNLAYAGDIGKAKKRKVYVNELLYGFGLLGVSRPKAKKTKSSSKKAKVYSGLTGFNRMAFGNSFRLGV